MTTIRATLLTCLAASLCGAGAAGLAADQPAQGQSRTPTATQQQTRTQAAGAQDPQRRQAGAGEAMKIEPQDLTDEKFVQMAAMSNMAEIQLSQLALKQTQDPQVREFARRMIADHQKAGEQLRAIAQKQNIQVPQSLDAQHERTMQKLQGLSGAQFDAAYMRQMAQDHDRAVALFEAAAAADKLDPQLQAFAKKTLPTLQTHDRLASDLRKAETRAADKTGTEEAPVRR